MANFYDYNTRLVHNKYYYGRKMIVLFIYFHNFDRHNIVETVLSCVTINSLLCLITSLKVICFVLSSL